MMLRDFESHAADFEETALDRDTLDKIGNNSSLICLPRSLTEERVKDIGEHRG